MSYKYILKYNRGAESKISVEAWPRLKQYATQKERGKPSFVIGSVSGSRTIMLWHFIDHSKKKYSSEKNGKYVRITFPPEDADAINDAYRTGLAAAVVDAAEDSERADAALRYISRMTNEEVWFWTSKLLNVIGDRTDRKKVLTAIYVMSGAIRLGLNGERKETQPKSIHTIRT